MNRSNNWLRVFGATLALVATSAIHAQTTDTGGIKGRVTDEKGQPLPGAVIKAKGPQGTKGAEADSNGNYTIPFLTPGPYEVTVTMDGYNTVVQSGVSVEIQKNSVQPFRLTSGGEVITVTGTKVRVDTGSSTSTTNVNLSQAIETFARPRDFASAFDFSPGVVANSGVGGGNPAINGASGLENQYVISGVNITNSGYGGIGAYDAVLGAQGVGVTTDFLESLDIRDGGFEAEYGGALGGVITATVKSGSNDWHGGVSIYFEPTSLEGARRNLYQPGGFTNTVGTSSTDVGLQIGGPIIKDKLFFFVAYNPVWTKGSQRLDISGADMALDQVTLPNANRDYDFATTRVDNFATRLTWNLNEKHKLDFIVFGSPQSSNGVQRSLGRRLNAANDVLIPVYPAVANGVHDVDSVLGAQGKYKVADYSGSIKYFGTITPWMNIEGQISYHHSTVKETPGSGADVTQYADARRTLAFNRQRLAGVTPVESPAGYNIGGYGIFQGDANDEVTEYTLKVTNNFNAGGSHELKYGIQYADINFREDPRRSGPRGANGPLVQLQLGNPNSIVPIRTGAAAQIRCSSTNPNGTVFVDTANPTAAGTGACRTSGAGAWVYRLTRGNFNQPTPDTTNKETNLFVQDKWTIKNVTLNLGLRWTKSKISNPSNYSLKSTNGAVLEGNNGQPVGSRTEACQLAGDYSPSCYVGGPGAFVGSSYSFDGEFSPRLGVSWDVLGNGKSKIYFNYSRLFERIPNDLAVRSLGNEFGLTRVNFSTPDLSVQSGSATTVGGDVTIVENGTKLPYKDDFVIGYQFELAPNFTVDVKANYRKQGRVLEDTQAAPVEAIQNLYYGLGSYLAGIDPAESARRLTYGCAPFGAYHLANVSQNSQQQYQEVDCGTYLPNGVFHNINFGGKPRQVYKALSITLSKQPNEGEHVSLQAVYRISRLTGNYEGLFRNDNGQDDPNISSLYDFPNTVATRSQFFDGRLNNDVPHSLRINVGYRDLFIKNMSGAVTFKWASGTPRTPYLAHPEYQNAGEIPGINQQYAYPFGGPASGFAVMYKYDAVQRGYLGRNPDIATWDAKLGYKWNLGKSALDFDVFVENLFNANDVTGFNDFVENSTGVENPNYQRPLTVHTPRNIRLGVKWSF